MEGTNGHLRYAFTRGDASFAATAAASAGSPMHRIA